MKTPSWEAGPRDDAPDPHPLAEEVLAILEDAGVETAINDAVCKAIEHWFATSDQADQGEVDWVAYYDARMPQEGDQ